MKNMIGKTKLRMEESPVLVRLERKLFTLKKISNVGEAFISLEEKRGTTIRRCFISSEGGFWLAVVLLKPEKERAPEGWKRQSDTISEISAKLDNNSHGRFLKVTVLPKSLKGRSVVIIIPEDSFGVGWRSLGEALKNFSKQQISPQIVGISLAPPNKQIVTGFSFKEALIGDHRKDTRRCSTRSRRSVQVVLEVDNGVEGWNEAVLCMESLRTKFLEESTEFWCIDQRRCAGEAKLRPTATGGATPSHFREVEDELHLEGASTRGATGLVKGLDQRRVRDTDGQRAGNDFNLNSCNAVEPPGLERDLSENSRVSGCCDKKINHVATTGKPDTAHNVGLASDLGHNDGYGPANISSFEKSSLKLLESMGQALSPVLDSLNQIVETSSIRALQASGTCGSRPAKRISRIFIRRLIRAKMDHTLLMTPVVLLDAPSSPTSVNSPVATEHVSPPPIPTNPSGTQHHDFSQKSSNLIIKGKRKNFWSLVESDLEEISSIKSSEDRVELPGGSLYDEVLVAETSDWEKQDTAEFDEDGEKDEDEENEFLRLGKSFASCDNEKRGKDFSSKAEEEEAMSLVERTKLHSLNSMLLTVGARMGIRNGPPRIQLSPWIKDLDKRLQQGNHRSKRTTAGRKPRRFRDSSHSEVM